ncbi:MAG: hypothetical protein LH702_28415 [Phormidesmis sp. CAN_BIN44]|nr:hypothetical protein [Phormidesmis sp. CAN_BIN44]
MPIRRDFATPIDPISLIDGSGNQAGFTDSRERYRESIRLLQSVRADLIAASPDLQFSFREAVEPVYREFVSLPVESPKNPQYAHLLFWVPFILVGNWL